MYNSRYLVPNIHYIFRHTCIYMNVHVPSESLENDSTWKLFVLTVGYGSR